VSARRALVLGGVGVLVTLIAWEVVGRSAFAPPALFPPVSRVAAATAVYAASGELLRDLLASVWRALAGLAIGSIAGVSAGLATGRIAVVRDLASPVLNGIRALPPVALIPLIIVWWGIGNEAKVISISLAVFFPVWVSTDEGARNLARAYVWAATAHGASESEILFRVVLPGSLPFIVAGLRNAVALSFVMVFVSELAGASNGLGYQIAVSHLAYRIDRMMGALAILALCAAVADAALVWCLRRAFPWLLP